MGLRIMAALSPSLKLYDLSLEKKTDLSYTISTSVELLFRVQLRVTKRIIMLKFALAKEHHLHFEKQQFIEIEDVIPLEQLLQMRLDVDKILALSMASYGRWQAQPVPDELFLEGRDLWRRSDIVKKIVLDRKLAQIAAELMRKRYIRLGFDQFLLGGQLKSPTEKISEELESARALLLNTQTNLEQIACLQGVLCGVMISLNSPNEPIEPVLNSIFPVKAGHVTYFTPQANINFSELSQREGQKFLLIVYAEKTTLYIPNAQDPNWHALKRLGYVFGDRVKDQLHPVLSRG